MAENLEQPPDKWTASQVSAWLRSFGVMEDDIKKLHEEEVNGRSLLTLDEDFLLTRVGMKSGSVDLILKKRDELIKSQQKSQEKKTSPSDNKTELEQKTIIEKAGTTNDPRRRIPEKDQNGRQNVQEQHVGTSEDCKPRPFDQDPDIVYVKHRVLPPESGAFNLISPCREFKSLQTAVRLDHTRLRTIIVGEVLKFAIGCMNARTNGTIYFGVKDSKEDPSFAHGEIIGIPVKEKDIYADALKCYEKGFSSNKEEVYQCVRPPRYIEVIDRESTEKTYVVEFDVEPSISIVRGKIFKVRLPKFNESTNKVEYEKETILRRMGAETKSVMEADHCGFFNQVKGLDAQRQEAETRQSLFTPEIHQNLGRKLTILITSGKKFIENEKRFLLVTNKVKPDDLCDIDWLMTMNIFCVFDFDPDSETSGLCGEYLQRRPSTNRHSLESFRKSDDTSIKEFSSKMHLFDQTSWIFCNGRTDFKGDEASCDEMTWIKTTTSLMRESVSLICKQIFPKGTFQVIFLLTSPVEKPLLSTLDAFFTEMHGHEDIMCICESEENFQKWRSFAEELCGAETVNNRSVVGMKMSHVNATVKQIQGVTPRTTKHLSTFAKGKCCLQTQAKDKMFSLEILTLDHCDETTKDYANVEKNNIERHFYDGGKVTWLNFWLAEREYIGEMIERDAYNEVCKLLDDLKLNATQSPVNRINIYHHPGSGGSTVARQVLWNKRKDLRCAVVKPSYLAHLVAKHAAELREHDEKDPQRCLPVLLLVEDSEQEYLDDLRNELEEAVRSRKIHYEKPCFIVLACRRSHNPEKKTTESPLENVSIIHKLSDQETSKFARKQQGLEEQCPAQFFLTFVLGSSQFKEEYVTNFVTHLLQGIDLESDETRLLLYVALMNTYVQNSSISLSLCEAFLGLSPPIEKLRCQVFEKSLSESTHLLFLQLRDEQTRFNSVKIFHPKVAEEILKQVLRDHGKRGSLAKELLGEEVLLEDRFGKEEFLAFLRELLTKPSRVSRRDENDISFSPLIEHVCKNESQDLAIDILKDAYHRFYNKDAFFAFQIAQFYHYCGNFDEANLWISTAASLDIKTSNIHDTNDDIPKTAQNTAAAVATAENAIEWLCQQFAVRHPETMNGNDAKDKMTCLLSVAIVGFISRKLTNQQEQLALPVLEAFLSLYPKDPLTAKLLLNEIVNYMAAHIALNCLSPGAPQVAPLKDLQALSRQLPTDKGECVPSALFLLTLLFWPDDHDTEQEKDKKYETVQSAVRYLEKYYLKKMTDFRQRKKMSYIHFFLGKGKGLDRFVPRSKFESAIKGRSINEKRMKGLPGEVWEDLQTDKMLKRVSGWTEDGAMYLKGPSKERFRISPSVCCGNKNITFYLGFTFRGPVSYRINVKK